ncbi:unnamed protein product, partial [Ectocarpus fasciculatus]
MAAAGRWRLWARPSEETERAAAYILVRLSPQPPSWHIHQHRVWTAPFAYGDPEVSPARGYREHRWASTGSCYGISFVHISIAIVSFCSALTYYLMIALQCRSTVFTTSYDASTDAPGSELLSTAHVTGRMVSLRRWWFMKWSAFLKDLEVEMGVGDLHIAPHSRRTAENGKTGKNEPGERETQRRKNDEEQRSRSASRRASWHNHRHSGSSTTEMHGKFALRGEQRTVRERPRRQRKLSMSEVSNSVSHTRVTAGGISVTRSETGGLSGGGETGGSGKGERMGCRKGSSAGSSTQGGWRDRERPPVVGGEGDTANRPGREAQSEHAAAVVVPPRHPDDLKKIGSSSIVRSDGEKNCGSSGGGGGRRSDGTRQGCRRR